LEEIEVKNALLSVNDKTGIEDFARQLVELDFKIWASGGTAEKISSAGIEVEDISGLVGGGAILGHKVVTLSREIHAGLLADENDDTELKELGIPRIDLVAVDMYALEAEIAHDGSSEKSVIEKTDMGGPGMLRSAAKGRRIVLSRAEQRQQVIDWLRADMPEEEKFKRALAADAEATVANYVLQSAKYISQGNYTGVVAKKIADTAYGENRWQQNSAIYSSQVNDSLSLDRFGQIAGSALSYNNYCDVDRLLQTMTHLAAGFDANFSEVPNIAVGGKHGNACGVGAAESPKDAITKMLEGDLRAIFGGSIFVNFEIDEKIAELLIHHKSESRRLLDVIVAPSITDEAIDILARKKGKCRLLVNPALNSLDKNCLDTAQRTRYVRGGRLQQQNYDNLLDLSKLDSDPEKTRAQDIVFGWAIGSTSNSNTITIVKDGQLLGNGVGQQDRVGAAELAVKRAKDSGHDIKNALAYSDSFFPFADGPMVLVNAGISTIFSTSGSLGDKKVREAINSAGTQIYWLPDSEIRGFYAH
jgi:phosphoribosylaminoimidazolecarboxamide formyltransferase/IMP cyclohydrolase